ncbi:MAG: sodium:solute symporter [Bacteroidetes bacterium]|nr:MAG: sodium:solute symporter [Bacteroidota bacterium]
MTLVDWLVMGGTITLIIAYGIWRSRGQRDIRGYFLSNNDQKWWSIGLSIMATQASAITFLSTPGQGFGDGMRFVQFYFGLPIAMVVISMVAIPIYRRLNVFTAYEYLEQRFDLKTRTLGALLFLLGRGLAAGITIVAPAIILETLLGWDLTWTCVGIGVLVMLYTVTGGTKAVAQTQQQQMGVILLGMLLAGVLMVWKLPDSVSFGDALHLAGGAGRLEVITLPDSFDNFIQDRYNILSGLVAGTFLALSYFGTDQSQVQRYLGGKSISEIRIGLLFNGIFKVPMQFLILFIGAMLFVFYQFYPTPMFFNDREVALTLESPYAGEYQALAAQYDSLDQTKRSLWLRWAELREGDPASANSLQAEALALEAQQAELREAGIKVMGRRDPNANLKDQDRVFLNFVLNHLPIGLVGLLMAVIFSAAMSSTAAELNALASTTVVDIYRRMIRPSGTDAHYLGVSRGLTFAWGVLAILFAITAGRFENLIEYVNILGSLFYGTILGLFVVAFFFPRIQGTATFWSGLVAEALVMACFFLPMWWPETFAWLNIGYLWFNLIGCVVVVLVAMGVQALRPE